jgi:hypothetical protein
MIQNKIYHVLVVLLLFIVQSIFVDSYTRRDRKYHVDGTNNDDYSLQSTYHHNRYSPYGPSKGNYRTRSRWPSSYEDSNDWSRYGYGLNNILSNFPASLPSTPFDDDTYLSNGPQCYSLLDPQYPLFSDICGAVPQARYSLPNLFGHIERWQIAQILITTLGQSTASPNPSCTRALRLLLCPLLFPPCRTRYEPPPVLPCQPFCRVVKNQCAAPSLDLLPCDLLPLSSDLCPINPSPYSSLLSSFAQPSPFMGGLPPSPLSQSALSSLLGQSAFPPSGASPSALSPFLSSPGFSSLRSPSALSTSPLNLFGTEPYMGDSLAPILVDFPPISYDNDYRQAGRYFPNTRSATVNS